MAPLNNVGPVVVPLDSIESLENSIGGLKPEVSPEMTESAVKAFAAFEEGMKDSGKNELVFVPTADSNSG